MINVFHRSPYAKTEIFKRLRYSLTSLKMAWQRATKGYCDRDLWNLNDFYLELFENSIRSFREDSVGTPGRLCSYDATKEQQNKAHEIWDNHLREIENHFHNALYHEKVFKNEYEEEYHNLYTLNITGNRMSLIPATGKEDLALEVKEKYFKRCIEIEKLREKEIRLGFEKLLEAFEDLWD